MSRDTSTIKQHSTVEVPPAVLDEIVEQLDTDADAGTVRDHCFDYLDRDTQFVTPDGHPVETAVRQR